MSSLSPRQITALKMLSYKGTSGESAYGLRVQVRTLDSLVGRGLVKYHPKAGDLFFPRQRTYSITTEGFAVVENLSE